MKKKVLFTIRSLTGGGAERVVTLLASKLSHENFDVHIIAYDKSEHDYNIDSTVTIHYMPKVERDNIFTKASRIFSMRKIIKKIKPDLVIPFVGTIVYVTWFASGMNKIPFIMTVRNNPWRMPEKNNLRKLRDFISKHSTAVFLQNAEQKEYFLDNCITNVPFFVIPNPVSDDFIKCKKDDYSEDIVNIIAVGRLNYQKNYPLMLQAIKIVVEQNKNVHLSIYGEGSEIDSITLLIKKLNLENNVSLEGRCDRIVEKLKVADLFLMTSLFEGMPNSLMEAMTVGLPCISTACKTGPKSLIENEKRGILVNESPKGIANAILHLIEHPEFAEEIGKNARAYMLKYYETKKIISNFSDCVSKCMEDK